MLIWARELNVTNYDAATAVATDGSGDVVIAGWTEGALAGQNRGGTDAFVAKYSGD